MDSREQEVGQAVPQVEQGMLRRAMLGASVGNCVEWFDFAVYGYLAATLGAVFFPSEDPTISLLSSFAVFGVAFFMRPLGGFFFGPLGDRIGRQRTLAAVIILMSASTFVIAFLPGYAAIGIWAPILLVAARLLQGFSVGGEFGGASAFLAEYSPDERRGYLVSWIEFSAVGGFFLGSASVLLLTATIGEDALGSWGWRIPFLLAGPLGLIGLYIRLRVEDTPEFRALERSGEVSGSPLRETIDTELETDTPGDRAGHNPERRFLHRAHVYAYLLLRATGLLEHGILPLLRVHPAPGDGANPASGRPLRPHRAEAAFGGVVRRFRAALLPALLAHEPG